MGFFQIGHARQRQLYAFFARFVLSFFVSSHYPALVIHLFFYLLPILFFILPGL
jgi:hypothetical protein